MSKGMFVALLVSVLLAVSLSFLPTKDLSRYGGGAASDDTTQSVPVMKDASVVDGLGTLSLQSRLQKVIWEQHQLTVTLAVPQAQLSQTRPWQDVYKIAYRFLAGVTEQRQVVVNIVANEEPDLVRYKVLAKTQDLLHAPDPNSADAAAYVQQKFRVTQANAE